jgi:hypothetical protein
MQALKINSGSIHDMYYICFCLACVFMCSVCLCVRVMRLCVKKALSECLCLYL